MSKSIERKVPKRESLEAPASQKSAEKEEQQTSGSSTLEQLIGWAKENELSQEEEKALKELIKEARKPK